MILESAITLRRWPPGPIRSKKRAAEIVPDAEHCSGQSGSGGEELRRQSDPKPGVLHSYFDGKCPGNARVEAEKLRQTIACCESQAIVQHHGNHQRPS